MNVYEAAMKRRSIRRFEDKPVPYEILEKCVDAGRLAPSGRNQQVCEFIIVDDKELLPEMFDNIGGSVKMPPEKGGPRPENTPKAYFVILITLLSIISVSRVSITLSSASASRIISPSSGPSKNRLSKPIILSHLASLPTLWTTMNLVSLISPPPYPAFDIYSHPAAPYHLRLSPKYCTPALPPRSISGLAPIFPPAPTRLS